VPRGSVYQRFKRALVEAKVGAIEMRSYKVKGQIVEKPFSPLRPHDLRHSFGTQAAMDPNISLREIQEWMGHKDAATTAIYAHFQPKSDAAERLGNAFKRGRETVLEHPVAPASSSN
jgi:integrase